MVIKIISRAFISIGFALSIGLLFIAPVKISAQGVIQGGEQASGSIGEDVGGSDTNEVPKEEIPFEEICEGATGEGQVDEDTNCDCAASVLDRENCAIVKYIEIGINVLTGLAGLAIVGGMMTGGYMYMTARDNPGQTAAGRGRVVWALVALLILIFFWGFLQWLVPGGVLESVGGTGNNAMPI